MVRHAKGSWMGTLLPCCLQARREKSAGNPKVVGPTQMEEIRPSRSLKNGTALEISQAREMVQPEIASHLSHSVLSSEFTLPGHNLTWMARVSSWELRQKDTRTCRNMQTAATVLIAPSPMLKRTYW